MNSLDIIEFKEKLLTGKEDAGCAKCYTREQEGVNSLRQQYNKMIPFLDIEKLSDPQYNFLSNYDLNLSNKCNQKCRICGPHNSTAWFKDAELLHKDANWIGDTRWQKENHSYNTNQTEIENILKNMEQVPFIDSITFKGGEPLYLEEVKILLRGMIDKKLVNKVKKIIIVTNGTVFDNDIISMLNEFPEVDLSISIDAVGKLHEYTRGTIITWDQCRESWSKLLTNLKYNKFWISNSVYIYTAFDQPNLINWVKQEFGENTVLSNITLFLPFYLNIKILLPDLVEQIIQSNTDENIKNIFRNVFDLTPVKTYIDLDALKIKHPTLNEDSYIEQYIKGQRQKFKGYTKHLDRIRNENILELLPDLSTMLA